jgi:hypothetical protein
LLVPDDRRVLEGVDRVIVDGTNVLHALSRSSVPVPAASLIGRLRAIVPPEVAIVVMLDGSPEHGLVSRRIASGVEVRYAGRMTADEAITAIVEREMHGFGTGGLLVVTDDIALSGIVRRWGGRTVRNGWLIDRLSRQRLSSPVAGKMVPGSIGRPAPGIGGGGAGTGGSGGSGVSAAGSGHSSAPGDNPDLQPEERRWSPGRGATRKRGNAHRGR